MPELGRELKALALIQRAEQRASDTVNHTNGRSADVSLPADSFPGYEITAEIHRGGQGVVYEALQKSTQRKVAIKAMKEGPFGRPGDRTRFEREVQILGQLKHPHIVTIHDSGSAAGGSYFVMDYIVGSALDEFMAGQEQSIPETLELFARVCDAVNAAHLHGIIHRDLKPSNIRVGPQEDPHILDFGLAKVITGEDERCGMTLTGQFVGSVPWASPEQAEGIPQKIDIRTDVYSLGMILFHMLTGRFPYEVSGNIRDVIYNILKAEPVRPSTIRKQIDNEVETIVLKCLSKEPERRYQTAGELVRDVRRYLAGEPIEAKRDSVGYVLRKHLHRYRLPAAIAATFVLVVTVGFFTSLAFWRNAVDERNAAEAARTEAERQSAITQAVNEFLNKDLLAAANPMNTPNRQITVKEVLDSASASIKDRLEDEPLVEAAIQLTVGSAYRELGEYELAAAHLERAVDLRRTTLGEEDAGTLFAANELALLYEKQGRYVDAESLLRSTLDAQQRALGEEHTQTMASMHNLALLHWRRGRYDEAIRLMLRSLALRQRVFGEDHFKTAVAEASLAGLYRAQGRYADAERLYVKALDVKRRELPADHPDVLTTMNNLGLLYRQEGKFDKAEALLTEALDIRRRVLGEEHQSTLTSVANLASLYRGQGRYGEALELNKAGLKIERRVLGDDHPDTLSSINSMGLLLMLMNRLSEAEQYCREAVDGRRRVLGDDHPATLMSIHNLGRLMRDLGRLEQAEALGAEAVRGAEANLSPTHWIRFAALAGHARTLVEMQRFAEAEAELLRAYDGFANSLGLEHERTTETIDTLIDLYGVWDRPNEAAAWRAKLPSPP
jgi:tetratricopeptide (TPR) repeat protein